MAELQDNSRGYGEVDGLQVDGALQQDGLQVEEARRQLQMWKEKVDKEDDLKGRLMLEKLAEDEAKMKAQQEMLACVRNHEECQKIFTASMNAVQDQILKFSKHKQDLLDKLKRCQAELEARRSESSRLKQMFKINAQIPDTEVRFTCQNKEESEENQPIRAVFSISQRPAVLLQGGRALVTFEEEKVAHQILKMTKCSVSCERSSVDVKPKRIGMETVVKFEIHMEISTREVQVSNVPPAFPEDRVRDRLEMSFSRPSRGGGEVEKVEYHRTTGSGLVTFLHPGVAEGLALRGTYRLDLDSEVKVQVGPVYRYQLRKFQTFCGTSRRTVLLDNIEDEEDEEDLQDHLEIHFQKPNNYGGEIESIRYISRRNQALQAFFSED